MIANAELPHRGRFQAQGGRRAIEKSETWAQVDPLTANEGHQLVNGLYDQLTGSEQEERQNGFNEARSYIDAVLATRVGVGPIHKSFPRKPNRFGARVDLEVHKGLAFVPDDEE